LQELFFYKSVLKKSVAIVLDMNIQIHRQSNKETKTIKKKEKGGKKQKQTMRDIKIRLRQDISHRSHLCLRLGHWAALIQRVVVVMLKLASGAHPAVRKARSGLQLIQFVWSGAHASR